MNLTNRKMHTYPVSSLSPNVTVFKESVNSETLRALARQSGTCAHIGAAAEDRGVGIRLNK